MARQKRSQAVWLRAVTAVGVAALLTACGGSSGEVTLEELVNHHGAFEGEVVVTRGTVQTVEEPRHYWLEDDEVNRVGLQPDERVSRLVGEDVIVRGRFSYSRDEGRWIRVDEVTIDVQR